MMSVRVTLAAALVAGVLAGCGETVRADVAAQKPAEAPSAKPYGGPLTGKNAAGKALECDGKVLVRSAGLNPQEDIRGSTTPEGAVANWNGDAMPFDHAIARDGYSLAARSVDRALFTWTYRGKVRSVAIAVNDKDPKTYLKGWGVLDAAWCNAAEFPAELDKNHWYEIWADRDGKRVSSTVLHSSPGAEHCNWESASFLFLDNGKTWYVRDPEGLFSGRIYGDSGSGFLVGGYRADVEMPDDAKDTGYRREGKQLHLTDDVAYLRYDDGHVEAWPRATRGWGCA